MYELSVAVFAFPLQETHTPARKTMDTLSNSTEGQLNANRFNSAYCHEVSLVQTLKI